MGISKRNKPARRAKPEEVCLRAMDSGADRAVMTHAHHMMEHLADFSSRLNEPGQENSCERNAVSQMLTHQINLALSTGISICTLLGHGDWSGVVMLGRPMMEFAVRAAYAAKYPDYSVWAINVDMPEKYYRFFATQMPAEERAYWVEELRKRKHRFRNFLADARQAEGLQPYAMISFSQMRTEILGRNGSGEVYRANSMLLHGDHGAAMIFHKIDHHTGNRCALDATRWMLVLAQTVSEWLGKPLRPHQRLLEIAKAQAALESRYYPSDEATASEDIPESA